MSLYYVANVAADASGRVIPDFLGLALLTTVAGLRRSASTHAAWQRPRLSRCCLRLRWPSRSAPSTTTGFQLNFSIGVPLPCAVTLASLDPARWRRGVAHALAIGGPVAVMLLAAFAPYSLPPDLRSADPDRVPRSPTARFWSTLRPRDSSARLADSRKALFSSICRERPRGRAGSRRPNAVLPWLNPATQTWPDVAWSRLSPEARRGLRS